MNDDTLKNIDIKTQEIQSLAEDIRVSQLEDDVNEMFDKIFTKIENIEKEVLIEINKIK